MNNEGTNEREITLPPLRRYADWPTHPRVFESMTLAATTPPIFELLASPLATLLNAIDVHLRAYGEAALIPLERRVRWSLAGFWALLAWLVGRWSQFSTRAVAGWTLGVFLLGLPGLLMMLWSCAIPRRVTCASCGRRRSVRNTRCQQCGAEFPPAAANGTEVFA